jgi:outer membrane receptor protein involved in Fe transport
LQRRDGITRFYTPEFDDGTPDAGVAHDLDYTNRENVFAQARYRRLSFSGGYNHRKRGLPTGAYSVVRNHRDTWVTDRHAFAEARTQATWGRWDTEIRGGYDNYEYIGSYPYFVDDQAAGVATNMDIGRGQWLTGGLQLSRRLAGRHHLTAGIERRQHLEERQLNYYTGEAPLLDFSRRSNTTGIYLQDEWRLHPTFLLNAGLRYDRYSAFSDPVKPRAAAIYQPTRRTAVKLLYGEAFRAPTVFETDYAFPDSYLSNPSLTPEETRRVETLVEHYAGSRARFTASWFRNSIFNLIDQRYDEVRGGSFYDNVAAVNGYGFETEAELKWPGGSQVLGSYTYSRLRNSHTSEQLTNSPAHLGQVRAATPSWRGTFLALDVRALSARWTPHGTVVGAYLVPNLTLSRAARGQGLGFSFTVANFTNTAYADPVATDFEQASVAQDGRTARLRVSWSF